jgi:AcrR family transcriptional regulator
MSRQRRPLDPVVHLHTSDKLASMAATRKAPSPALGRPARLSREIVVAAAIDIVRERSLHDVTMRSLAERLEATPMALYRHVGDRDALALLVVDAVFRSLVLPSASLQALEYLRELARGIRALGRAHHGVMDVLLEHGPAVKSTLVILDVVVRKLHDEGASWQEAAGIHNTFLSWVASAVHREERWTVLARKGSTLFRHFTDAAGEMSAAEYPGLAAVLAHMPGTEIDTEFEYSLAFMLDGVKARLSLARRPASSGPSRRKR